LLLEPKNEKHAIGFSDCNQTPDDVSEWDVSGRVPLPRQYESGKGFRRTRSTPCPRSLNSDVREHVGVGLEAKFAWQQF
jgi:hypothetical protein